MAKELSSDTDRFFPENRPTVFVHIREDYDIPIVSVSEGFIIPSEQLPEFHEGMLDLWLDDLRAMFSDLTVIEINQLRFEVIEREAG